MSISSVQTDLAPAAIGPYSQAVRSGDSIYCSGQIGLDPATGELVKGGVESECHQVLKNLTAVLRAAGVSWNNVVKVNIYLINLADFALVNQLYGECVGTVPPARATVQVAALPRGASVEIDAIAHAPFTQ